MEHEGFIEVAEGLYYNVEDGSPWTTRIGGRYSNKYYYPKPIKINCKDSSGYYSVRIDSKTVRWHRLIWKHFNGVIPSGLIVDHINNNQSDNRIVNLQLATQHFNVRACKKYKNNKSGFVGVTWAKLNNKWVASIRVNNKTKHLGLFDDPEIAHQAYLSAKIKYHGADSIRF